VNHYFQFTSNFRNIQVQLSLMMQNVNDIRNSITRAINKNYITIFSMIQTLILCNCNVERNEITD